MLTILDYRDTGTCVLKVRTYIHIHPLPTCISTHTSAADGQQH
jgi:hypothetical protein